MFTVAAVLCLALIVFAKHPTHSPVIRHQRSVFSQWGVNLTDDFSFFGNLSEKDNDYYIKTYLDYEMDWSNYNLDHRLLDEMVTQMGEQFDAALWTAKTEPVEIGNYEYYEEQVKGGFGKWYRKSKTSDADEKGDLIIDLELYRTKDLKSPYYFRFGRIAPSPDGSFVAFSYQLGLERFTVAIVDMSGTEGTVKETIPDVYYNFVWSLDSKHLMYEHLLDLDVQPLEICVHENGHAVSEDKSIFPAMDRSIELKLSVTSDGLYCLLTSSSLHGSKVAFLDRAAFTTASVPTELFAFVEDREYYVDHHAGYWYERTQRLHDGTDTDTLDFSLARFQLDGNQTVTNYEIIRQNAGFMFLDHFEFAAGGQLMAWFTDKDTTEQVLVYYVDAPWTNVTIKFDSEVYNDEFYALERVDSDPTLLGVYTHGDAGSYSVVMSSLISPPRTYKYTFADGKLEKVSEQKVAGDYDKSLYYTKRYLIDVFDDDLNATVSVPSTVVYQHFKMNKKTRELYPLRKRPLLLYVYGAYGTSILPSFRPELIPWMKLGFWFAIAHVRGGGVRGHEWRDAGRRLQKHNTFNDLVGVLDYFQRRDFTTVNMSVIEGRSAGGLPCAWMAIHKSHMINTSICEVPFVAVLDSMNDPKIAYTEMEFYEWGNPVASNDSFQEILSYDPFYNVMSTEYHTKNRQYPNLFLSTGKQDARVGYWQPLKLIHAMRERQDTSKRDSLMLLNGYNTDHFGHRGNLKWDIDYARKAAFTIKLITGWQWHDPLEWLWILISIIVLGLWMVMFMMIFIICELRNRKKKLAEEGGEEADRDATGYGALPGDEDGDDDAGVVDDDFSAKQFAEDRRYDGVDPDALMGQPEDDV